MDDRTEFDYQYNRNGDLTGDFNRGARESEIHDETIEEIRALRQENEQLRTEIKKQLRAQSEFLVKQIISIVKWSLIIYTVVIFAIKFICSYIFR